MGTKLDRNVVEGDGKELAIILISCDILSYLIQLIVLYHTIIYHQFMRMRVIATLPGRWLYALSEFITVLKSPRCLK